MTTNTPSNINTAVKDSTNILKITFSASMADGLMFTNEQFKPAMLNPEIYKSYPNVLFIPTIRLSNSLLPTNLGKDDIRKIFLSPNQLANFIEKLQTENQFKPMSITDARNKGIIKNNISFILDILFPSKQRLYFGNKVYTLNNYTWNDKYTLTPVAGKKAPIVEVFIKLFVQSGKDMSFLDSSRISCSQKWNTILQQYASITGAKISDKVSSSYKKPFEYPKTPSELRKERMEEAKKKGYLPSRTTTTTTTTYYGGKKSKKNRNIKAKTKKCRIIYV